MRRRRIRRGGDSTTIFVDVFLTVLVVLMLASRDRTELGLIDAVDLAEAASTTALDAAALFEVMPDDDAVVVVCSRGCTDDRPRPVESLPADPPRLASDQGPVAVRIAADVRYGDAVDARRALADIGIIVREQGAVR